MRMTSIVRSVVLIAFLLGLMQPAFAGGGGEVRGGAGWDGFYVGAHGGYGRQDVEVSGVPGFTVPDLEGGVVGIHGGYNYVVRGFLFGIEGDLSLANVDSSVSFGPLTLETSLSRVASVRGRVGYVFDQFMVFGTLGVAQLKYEVNLSAGLAGLDDSGTERALAYGGGAEWRLMPGVSLRGEYIGYRIDDDGIDQISVGDVSVVRAGVNISLCNFGTC